MSDHIPPVSEPNQDRSELNIGGHKKNKTLVMGGLLLTGLFVIISAVSFAIVRFETPEVPDDEPSDTHYNAGLDQSSLIEADQYFAAVGQEIKRKKQLAAETLAIKQEEVRAQQIQEQQIKAPPIQQTEAPLIQRVSSTSSGQPPPRVSGQSTQSLTPEQRRMSGAVMVSINSTPSPAGASREYDDSYHASTFEKGSAQRRQPGELDFLLIHGTAIPCVLYTQIISDHEGFVTCRVSEDVYSANGSTLLVERGSLVSGTQKVAMELGKARVFTNWADIETPLGVSIRIDSLGAGPLGASGHQAWVDNHFGERFGGAILLSFVDDALGALSDQASNDEIQYDNSMDNASDMASQALDANINIAPTGYSYIGQRINILVARDIDMSGVY